MAEPTQPLSRPNDSTSPHLLVIVLAWKNERFVDCFVRSLDLATRRLSDGRVTLLTLQNGSEGQVAADALEAATYGSPFEFQRLSSDVNLGYAGGMQFVADHIDFNDFEACLFTNLDGWFDSDALVELQRANDEEPTWEILVPSVRTGSKVTVALTRDRTGRFRRRGPNAEPGSRVAAGSGACLVLSRSCLQRRIGSSGVLFHPEYHSYGEDQELFLWAHESGIEVVAWPEMRFNHFGAGSTGDSASVAIKEDWLIVHIVSNFLTNQSIYGPHRFAHFSLGLAGYITLLALKRPRQSCALIWKSLSSWRCKRRAVLYRRSHP